MKYFSMFSGIGGFELGIQQAYSDKQSSPIEQDGKGGNRDSNEGNSINVSRRIKRISLLVFFKCSEIVFIK